MLVSTFKWSDWLIEQVKFFECHTVFTRAIVGRVTLRKSHPHEIYARTVRIEKPMADIATFLARGDNHWKMSPGS